MRIGIFVLLFLGHFVAKAQYAPIGLFEGLMGNSGVATQSSSASSYYNPSLLLWREDNSYSFGGTSISSSESQVDNTSTSSAFQISPAYLSTVKVGTSLVHELFMATELQNVVNSEIKSGNLNYLGRLSGTRLATGYSMAFRSFPFAMQVLGRYSEYKNYANAEGPVENSTNPQAIYIANIESEYKNLNVGLGFSTHFNINHYSFGANLNTRGWSLFNNSTSSGKLHVYGYPNPTDFQTSENASLSIAASDIQNKLSIGHGFKVGNHEFLTDTIMYEHSNSLDTYFMFQTFGYRYIMKDDDQFLCGLTHQFGQEIEYLGHSMMVSVGYSWTTRKLRSALGGFFAKDDTRGTYSNYGLTFSSQFEY